MGSLAAIGIVKGQPFAPDDADAQDPDRGRSHGDGDRPNPELASPAVRGARLLPRLRWTNYLFVGAYTFETPPTRRSARTEW